MSNTPVMSRWTYTLVDHTNQEYFFDEIMIVSQAALTASKDKLLTAFNRKSADKGSFKSQTMPNTWTDIIEFQAREVNDLDKDLLKETFGEKA